jgi:hypothetical protein
MWSVLAKKGQIYGNRNLETVNNANLSVLAILGIEIMTGYVDTLINSTSIPTSQY